MQIRVSELTFLVEAIWALKSLSKNVPNFKDQTTVALREILTCLRLHSSSEAKPGPVKPFIVTGGIAQRQRKISVPYPQFIWL